jgi:hypothetical protein
MSKLLSVSPEEIIYQLKISCCFMRSQKARRVSLRLPTNIFRILNYAALGDIEESYTVKI